MKILHTSDWHVGKVLKGRDRYDEHVAVLGSIVTIARDEDVDLVLVAGDLFETSAPTAKSQGLVMRTLLALRRTAGRSWSSRATTTTRACSTLSTGPCSGSSGCTYLACLNAPSPAATFRLH